MQDKPGLSAESIIKSRKTFSLSTLIVVALIVGAVGFVSGTRSSELVGYFIPGAKTTDEIDFSSLKNVYATLKDKFDGQLDPQAMVDGAKKGMVNASGDPHTVYFTNKEAEEFFSELDGRFSGIGAELGKKDGILIVITPLDGTPALQSGLRPGDMIVKVNDQDTTEWSIEKAVSEIRGEKGTSVKLTILRDQELKDFSIVRDQIVNPSARYEITTQGIGYLRISRFSDVDTIEIATKAANDFKSKGVKGVVLDLRGNGGGYLGAAQDVAGLWLQDKVIVEDRRGNQVVETLRSGNNAILAGVPTVVLIDGGSASASEIVAGALKDYSAAKLLGTKTFGKGSVQTVESLASGGQLKVTVAKWYTPNGKNIDKEGIEPDINLELTKEDAQASRDPQKDRAFEILK